MDSIWTLAFSVIMIISICGNTIVLWIVLGINVMLDIYVMVYHLTLHCLRLVLGFSD